MKERQEVTEHSVKHVAVGFVCVARMSGYTNISADIKCDVSTFMNQCGSISIEYPKQVKVLACFGIAI